jgi:hypothetical protein
MGVSACSFVTAAADSLETGREAAAAVCEGLGTSPTMVVAYLTVNHDQQAFLSGMRQVVGHAVPIVGCSTQGVVGRGLVREEGYAAGVLALGGEALTAAHAAVEEIAGAPFEKGRELGRILRAGLAEPPKAVVLYYDPLSGMDPERFLEGLIGEVECPIVGGAAAHSFNYQSLQETFQYSGDRVLTGAATAFALSGEFSTEFGNCHGCSPVGIELTVTAAERNVILELDGRRASDVWVEICGDVSSASNPSAALAIGVPVSGKANAEYFVRAAYVIDTESGTVTLGPAIPTGTRIMLHHRLVEDVLEGARRMGADLGQRLRDRAIRAVLGFECGARTRPFLGDEATRRENLELQRELGGDSAWLGMIAWGELFPVAGKPSFHNYSYPILAIAE